MNIIRDFDGLICHLRNTNFVNIKVKREKGKTEANGTAQLEKPHNTWR